MHTPSDQWKAHCLPFLKWPTVTIGETSIDIKTSCPEADAHMIAAAPQLLQALRWSEQFHLRPGEGYTECFERIAEIFHRETGYMRPGKDASPHAGTSMEERQAAWDKWIADGIARERGAIAAATSGEK